MTTTFISTALLSWAIVAQAFAASYSTNFPLTEDPISEGGSWINGAQVGLDWNDVRTVSGMAFGTEPADNNYADATALLSGSWGSSQTAQGTVKVQKTPSGSYEEVEVRLRSIISAHWCSGYEVGGSVSSSHTYIGITRWNGALGEFTQLAINNNVPTLKDGDVLSATVIGDTITAYLNGVQVLQARDSTFPNGSPGIGFDSSSGNDSVYGFSSFSASDSAGLPSPTPTPRHAGGGPE
jgi:hypothetical protein